MRKFDGARQVFCELAVAMGGMGCCLLMCRMREEAENWEVATGIVLFRVSCFSSMGSEKWMEGTETGEKKQKKI